MSTGKTFEKRIQRWIKDSGALCYKWPDHASTGTYQKALCDLMAVKNGVVFFFECKHINSKTSFALRLIKDHQIKSLSKLAKETPWVFYVIENGYKHVYMVPAREIKNKKVKSIKFAALTPWKLSKQDFINLICTR